MRPSLRAIGLAAIATMVLSSAAACSSSGTNATKGGSPGSGTAAQHDAGTPVKGGTLAVGLSGEPSSLDSAVDSDASGYVIARAIYDPLFQLNRDGSLTPMLAKSVKASHDQKTFTVTLRDGLKFSDGTPLNGAAVVAHYKRLIATPTASIPAELRQTKISAQGNVVTFVVPTPWSAFPAQALARNVGLIGSAAAEKADPAKYAQYPVGDGPFKVSKYVAGSEVTVVRNPDYWQQDRPYLDSITFHFLKDSQTRLQSLASGSLDFIQSSDVSQSSQAKSMGLQTQVNVGLGPVGIYLNTTKGALADQSVRVALAEAIDPSVISKVVYKGLAPVATGFAPPDSPAAQGSAAPKYDEAAAKAAIAAYGSKISIVLTTLPSADFINAAQVVQQMWQKVGVQVTIKQIDVATLLQTIFVKHNYQAYLSNNFNEGVPTSQSFVLFVKGAGANPTGIDDPQLIQAYGDGMAAADKADQTAAWKRAEQRIVSTVPAIPLVQKVGLFVWNKKVHGVPKADPEGVQMFNVAGMWVSN